MLQLLLKLLLLLRACAAARVIDTMYRLIYSSA
jgi:hypothetical protein